MDLRIFLLNFNFAMIYIIHKILALIKNHMNYFKDNILKCFSKRLIDFYFLKKLFFFSKYIMMENPRPEEEKIIKDIRNLFRLKKEQNNTVVTDIRNELRI